MDYISNYYTNLPQKYDDMFIYLLREYLDKDIDFSTGMKMNMIKKAESVYSDLHALNIDDDLLYRDLFYNVIKNFSVKRPDIIELNARIMSKTLFNEEFRDKVKQMNTWKSGYISFMKSVIPKLEELLQLLSEEKSYLAMKKYAELLSFLNIEALDPKMSSSDKSAELEKRYYIPYNTINSYNKRAKDIEFRKENPFIKIGDIEAYNYSHECLMLQRYLYQIMIKYYEKSGCFYRQINNDVGLFLLKDESLLTYKYDDLPGMTLSYMNKTVDFKDGRFWATIASLDFDLMKAKITDNAFNMSVKSHLGGKIVVCPDEYMDEAFYQSNIDKDGNINIYDRDKLYSIDFPLDEPTTSKLLTTDGLFYFKNPLLVDELKIKNIEANEFLQKLVPMAADKRGDYLKKLKSYYKGAKEKIKVDDNKKSDYHQEEKEYWWSK